ncbi:esterase family protein [Rhodocytophaga rosea]|uniref:Esterase family protein n=1 Tax=Rhodocytophaga rosea TaxID=2704465 RepID=A0A6C0GEN2_9BACT|nr:alpha/beta hydrolase-fold protein [Rhodocytophaga rosea]QHT66233.1 esterase family protein [Rhodocytophaga rosea]
MKLIIILSFSFLLNPVLAQESRKGKVIVERFLAPSLQGNRGGEDPMRRLTIYLPPGYQEGARRYPVFCFLHGFLVNDSLMMVYNRFKELMDMAILSGKLHPMILVLPSSDTKFGGSYYTNSALTGNWADYIGKDVVNYIDQNYRTLANRNSRGLCGHSMGGYGALKIGMLFPDTFGAVYALSPATLNWAAEYSLTNPAFKGMDSFRNEYSAKQITDELPQGKREKFYIQLMADLARTYSPDEGKNFLSAAMPVTFVGDSMVVHKEILAKWEANFPVNMIDQHLSALKQLNALKIDWGRNEEFPHIPITCLQFSKKLEANGVKHFAEEYIGVI